MSEFEAVKDSLVPNVSIITIKSRQLPMGQESGIYKGHNSYYVWYRPTISNKKLELDLIDDIEVSEITAP